MQSVWPLAIGGMAIIAIGLWQLFMPLDFLWAQQERALLARGLSPQRSDLWESRTRWGGGGLLILGIFFLLFIATLQASAPQPMSGVTINGHELTKAEWDDCHHDAPTCLTIYMNRPSGQ